MVELTADPLHPRELIMTLLGGYVWGRRETVWSGGLVTLLTELGFSTGAARAALTRFAGRDLLARTRRGRHIHYRLTDRAKRLLAEGDRRIFSLGTNAGPADAWTMLWHGIPEAQRLERGRLARRLRFLGFGTPQDGLWLSPRDRQREVVPILEEHGIVQHCGVLVGRFAGFPGTTALVQRAWDLESLCERYRAYTSEFKPYARRRGVPRLDDPAAFRVRTRVLHLYRAFPFLDPDLPDELMPDPRARPQAVAVFSSAYEALAAPAQRHFDLVTGRP
jgi:phenylacetic acid degradation operon negative regulatory protein